MGKKWKVNISSIIEELQIFLLMIVKKAVMFNLNSFNLLGFPIFANFWYAFNNPNIKPQRPDKMFNIIDTIETTA